MGCREFIAKNGGEVTMRERERDAGAVYILLEEVVIRSHGFILNN